MEKRGEKSSQSIGKLNNSLNTHQVYVFLRIIFYMLFLFMNLYREMYIEFNLE